MHQSHGNMTQLLGMYDDENLVLEVTVYFCCIRPA
jgi:hypothetical protein